MDVVFLVMMNMNYNVTHIEIKQLYIADYGICGVSRITYSCTHILSYHSWGITYDTIYVNGGLQIEEEEYRIMLITQIHFYSSMLIIILLCIIIIPQLLNIMSRNMK